MEERVGVRYAAHTKLDWRGVTLSSASAARFNMEAKLSFTFVRQVLLIGDMLPCKLLPKLSVLLPLLFR